MLATTCEFYHDEVTVMSFIDNKLFVPKEQHAIVRFLWANELDANKIQTACVQYMAVNVLQNQQYTFGVRKY